MIGPDAADGGRPRRDGCKREAFMHNRILKTLAAGVAAAALAALPARAEETLRAVAMFPKGLIYTQSFLQYVDKVNAAGKGVVQINFVGGPEAIPTFEQAAAVRDGVVDMVYGPGSYYPGDVPETDALVASNVSPLEQRENGGIDLFNQIHQKKLNVYYLGHMDGGIKFHIYLREKPKMKADGTLDLSGAKLRGAPIYREFFTDYLGSTFVQIPVPEVYTSLERGAVDGLGWTSIGLMDLSWDKLLKYRVDPGFFQTDLGVLVNLGKWNGLSDAAKKVLQDTALEHEKASYEALQALHDKENAEVQKRGMQIITLEGANAEKFLQAAYDVPWARLKGRDPTHYDALREKFYSE
jgi:TRAP-type C4-dicarboxylate transport system substrate-binding protein